MCALEIGLPWRAHTRPVNHLRLRNVIMTGVAVGIVSTASFGIVHALATFVLTLASSGPIPVVNGSRAAWLFAGFIPICAAAGITMAVVRQSLEPCNVGAVREPPLRRL